MNDLAPRAAVTYVGLPIRSGGAHSLGRMSRRDAHERSVAFLLACTEPVGAIQYAFKMSDPPELGPVPRLERELRRRFRRDGEVPMQRVGDALDFLDDIDPQPTNRWGMAPVWFWMTSTFRILDPVSRRPLPGQSPARFQGVEYEWRVPLGTSGMRLILHNTASIGLELCIPTADDETLRRVVPWLQLHLPFRLSPKHWRAWTLTKAGSWEARKIRIPGDAIG